MAFCGILEPFLFNFSQPQVVASVLPGPEATSTPVRPQSPTGIQNEQYSDSLTEASEDDSEDAHEAAIEPPALSDSGLEESATEFEFSRPSRLSDEACGANISGEGNTMLNINRRVRYQLKSEATTQKCVNLAEQLKHQLNPKL